MPAATLLVVAVDSTSSLPPTLQSDGTLVNFYGGVVLPLLAADAVVCSHSVGRFL